MDSGVRRNDGPSDRRIPYPRTPVIPVRAGFHKRADVTLLANIPPLPPVIPANAGIHKHADVTQLANITQTTVIQANAGFRRLPE